jgi:hypothetical protein
MMKIRFLTITLFLWIVGIQAANNEKLVGTWEIVEFKLTQKGNTTVSDEQTLRDSGAEWNMYFFEDGSFKQEFNMRDPSMKMETETGKWSTSKDSLFIELKIDTLTRNLKYYYVMLGDAVSLTLQHPTSPDKIITRFRRKRVVK